MKRMMTIMAMVVMMVSSMSAKSINNRPNYGKQEICTCCANKVNKPVTLPAPVGQRPVEIGKPQNSNNSSFNKKNTSKKTTKKSNKTNTSKSSTNSFGNMKR